LGYVASAGGSINSPNNRAKVAHNPHFIYFNILSKDFRTPCPILPVLPMLPILTGGVRELSLSL
ncbi:MAG: hypothetical protein K8R91_05680, partial [Phycisphaerae bacterium]|nr:hypothetical protein [Phycisphaerae bacterium]